MNMSKRNKIAGAIYGFAIGDAMGATTEFMSEKEIRRTYGRVHDIIGGGWLKLQPGEVTDDTQMTMCVMDAIMKMPDTPEEFSKYCADNFIAWLKTRPKDVGGQCYRGIISLMQGKYIERDETARGNGSLMRAMPLAVLGLPLYNIIQGELTHSSFYCSTIILEYTELIQEYLEGKGGNLYTFKVKSLLEPSGCILNTFNNAIYWSKKQTFSDAIIGAVNHGGDADTIAAVTGSLAGAKFGYDAIPEKWINQLNPDVKEFLEKFKNFVFSCVQI